MIAGWDEKDRIATLRSYRILDTPHEPEFDNLVQLAAWVCCAPRAAINLIDATRQWFKAEVGLGVREMPLDVSVCASVVLEPGLTVVPDLRSDGRFVANPIVMGEPGVRFYAGVRLETQAGVPLGTLCVLDSVVRDLSSEQRFALITLAQQAMSLLDARLALVRLAKAGADLEAAQSAQQLLIRELHHRVKNTLATVQAITGSTARLAGNIDQFQSALSGRIGALAKTHSLITDNQYQTASLLALLECELEMFADTRADRLTLDGPNVNLASEIAIPLGLAIHELGSNAARFGSLSNHEGTLNVSWKVENRDGVEVVDLKWSEDHGPAVRRPKREGFGSKMLKRVLSAQIGAEVSTQYDPLGVRVNLSFPLQRPTTTALN